MVDDGVTSGGHRASLVRREFAKKENSTDSMAGQFSRGVRAVFERVQNVSFAPVNLPRRWRANDALTYRHNPPANERPSYGPYVPNERAPLRLMDSKHAFEIVRFRELFRSRRKHTPILRSVRSLDRNPGIDPLIQPARQPRALRD